MISYVKCILLDRNQSTYKHLQVILQCFQSVFDKICITETWITNKRKKIQNSTSLFTNTQSLRTWVDVSKVEWDVTVFSNMPWPSVVWKQKRCGANIPSVHRAPRLELRVWACLFDVSEAGVSFCLQGIGASMWCWHGWCACMCVHTHANTHQAYVNLSSLCAFYSGRKGSIYYIPNIA